MKISEDLISAYSHGEWISSTSVKVLRDALQQAVAENLELKHIRDQHNTDASDCEGGIDWLAEADKLLRGEK